MTPADINLIFWAAFFFMGFYAGRHTERRDRDDH